MKQTAKRFWNWHTLIVVLIISLLIAIVVFFKRCMTTDTADIERVGNEIIGMIDDFQKRNNRLPVGLNELGSPFTDRSETYEYRDYLFYYEPAKDGQYWLTVTYLIIHQDHRQKFLLIPSCPHVSKIIYVF